jgi:hypothetical protein
VTTLLDTGPLVAAAHREDDAHTVCARLFAELQGALLLPSTVLIEACWIINARMGANAHANFLGRLGDDIASDPSGSSISRPKMLSGWGSLFGPIATWGSTRLTRR